MPEDKSGPGGRKPGSRNRFPSGIKAAVEACRKADADDPRRHECEGIILQVMRGEISGRHVQTRLSAAVIALELARGKPTQRVEVREPDRNDYRTILADGEDLDAAGPLPVPTGPPN